MTDIEKPVDGLPIKVISKDEVEISQKIFKRYQFNEEMNPSPSHSAGSIGTRIKFTRILLTILIFVTLTSVSISRPLSGS
jgi:hypothetical protein